MTKSKDPKVEKADIPTIQIPEGVSFRHAAQHCSMAADAQEEEIEYARHFLCLPWEGAKALETVLTSAWSAVEFDTTKIDVPIGEAEKVPIAWGVWKIAGLGRVACGVNTSKGSFAFSLEVSAPRSESARVADLFGQVEKECKKRPLYAGRAVYLEPDDEGDLNVYAPPRVVDLDLDLTADSIILPQVQQDAIDAEVLLPISKRAELARAGLPAKRGVLLAGRPGTGKTLTARVAAASACREGFVVFYLPDARAVETALRLADAYAPALLICEDLDRQTEGRRDAMTDRLLNALDGLSSSSEVVFLATTNAPESLPEALIRPGRLDTFLMLGAPDVDASRRHLALHLGADRDDLGPVAELCAGLLPAAIREVVTRGTLHAIMGGRGFPSAQDLTTAAQAVRAQQNIMDIAEAAQADKKPVLRVAMVSPGGTGHAINGAKVNLTARASGVDGEVADQLRKAVNDGLA